MDRNTPLAMHFSTIPPHPPGRSLEAPPPKPPEAWTHRLTRWLQLLVLTAPAAFLMGYSYERAHVRALGLVPSDFPLTTAEYMYAGLKALASVVVHLGGLLSTRPDLVRDMALTLCGFLFLFLITYRLAEWAQKRFRERVQVLRVKLTRVRRHALERYTPETVVALVAMLMAMLPGLVLLLVFFVVLIPFSAERAGRADAFAFWRSLETPKMLATFPTAEVPGANGKISVVHVIDTGTSSYMLYDGQRFSMIRKELLPRQLGAAPPWKP